MNVEIFLHQEQPIDPQAVRALYTSVGWWPERTTKQIARVLNSDIVVGAWDTDHLIGFARVISDYCFHAYIEDVMVHPDYQRRGIGKRLLARLSEPLSHIGTITLFCSSKYISFYEKQGFRVFPSQMVMHRKQTTSAL